MIEKRTYPRFKLSFPISITSDAVGRAVDVSETGFGFILRKPLLLSEVTARIELTPKESIEAKFKLIWQNHQLEHNGFRYGACFIRLKEGDAHILRNICSGLSLIDKRYIELTDSFAQYVQVLISELNDFDRKNPSRSTQIAFLETRKEEIFKKFDLYFEQIWEIVKKLDRSTRMIYLYKYAYEFNRIFGQDIAINWRIYMKPLGYAGDYIVMNYIYDYSGSEYMGNSSFQRLINNYTCNIPFARSNIARKDFIKGRILSTIKCKENPTILSVGSGPMRELIELLREGRVKNDIKITCLDFEKEALDYVKNEIKKITQKSNTFLNVIYEHKDVMDFVSLKIKNTNFDLIYTAGLFDYLRNATCLRVCRKLYSLLNDEGNLLICNASLDNATHRGYYEFLGDWVMQYRRKEDMLSWVRELDGIPEISFEQPSDCLNYLFMCVKKSLR